MKKGSKIVFSWERSKEGSKNKKKLVTSFMDDPLAIYDKRVPFFHT